jgi:hypothetical protein
MELWNRVSDAITARPLTAIAVTNGVSATLFLWLYARSKGLSLTQVAALGAIAVAKRAAPGLVDAKKKARRAVSAAPRRRAGARSLYFRPAVGGALRVVARRWCRGKQRGECGCGFGDPPRMCSRACDAVALRCRRSLHLVVHVASALPSGGAVLRPLARPPVEDPAGDAPAATAWLPRRAVASSRSSVVQLSSVMLSALLHHLHPAAAAPLRRTTNWCAVVVSASFWLGVACRSAGCSDTSVHRPYSLCVARCCGALPPAPLSQRRRRCGVPEQ